MRAAHNLVLTEAMLALHTHLRRFTQGAELHGAIVEHVVRRDADVAAKAVGVLFELLCA